MAGRPDIASAARMHRWRRNDITAVTTQIDALGKARAASDQATGMREIEMAPAAPGYRLDRLGQQSELPLQALKRSITPMRGVDINYKQIRYLACDDPDIGIRPTAEPAADLLRGWARGLQRLPSDQRPLVTASQRQNRPSASQIALGCFALGSLCHVLLDQ